MNTSYAAPPQQLNDVEYAAPGGISLRLDAAIPAGRGPFPAAILVHGGGWVRGDRRLEVNLSAVTLSCLVGVSLGLLGVQVLHERGWLP